MAVAAACSEKTTITPEMTMTSKPSDKTLDVDIDGYTIHSASAGVKSSQCMNNTRYEVRCNTSWEIVPMEEYDWIQPFPPRGDKDGYFAWIIDQSYDAYTRTAYYNIVIDGVAQPDIFTISQDGVGPKLSATVSSFKVPAAGSDLSISLTRNIETTLTVVSDTDDADADWIVVRKDARNDLQLTVLPSQNAQSRQAVLRLSGVATDAHPEHSAYSLDITVSQSGNSGSEPVTLALWSFDAAGNYTAGVNYNLTNPNLWYKSDDLRSMIQFHRKYTQSGYEDCKYTSGKTVDTGTAYNYFIGYSLWPGDDFRFSVPVADLEPGEVSLSFIQGNSNSGPKYWLVQWSFDEVNWTDIDPVTEWVTYDHDNEKYAGGEDHYATFTYFQDFQSVAQELYNHTVTFDIPAVKGNATLYIRSMVNDRMQLNRIKDCSASTSGGTRLAIKAEVTYTEKDE